MTNPTSPRMKVAIAIATVLAICVPTLAIIGIVLIVVGY